MPQRTPEVFDPYAEFSGKWEKRYLAMRRAVNGDGQFPTEQAAFKCLLPGDHEPGPWLWRNRQTSRWRLHWTHSTSPWPADYPGAVANRDPVKSKT